MGRHKSHRIIKAPKQIAILFRDGSRSTGLGLAKSKAHFIGKHITGILTALDNTVERDAKVNPIGFVLATNVLTLVSIVPRNIDNLGLVLELLFDGRDDDLVLLLAKGLANKILQSFVKRARFDFTSLGRTGCTHSIALENLGRPQTFFGHLQRRTERQYKAFHSRFDGLKILVTPNGYFLNQSLQVFNLQFFLIRIAPK
jgi:hypothetical protein